MIGEQAVTDSGMWCLTVLMLSPVTHCHSWCIYGSATVAESIKIDLDQ